ncbi:hypothetical protein G9A89_011319 [Geosiphon pyriformis]|nr:hypothetical protein G9A89_011319 [Geosiphon pyriformis]
METSRNETKERIVTASSTPLEWQTPLKVNTQLTKESVTGSFPSPTSPSFRRILLPNMRQSWIVNKPSPIPETQSIIRPTPILEKNGLSAKSRLSLLIQKGPIGNRNSIGLNLKLNELGSGLGNESIEKLNLSLEFEESKKLFEEVSIQNNEYQMSDSPIERFTPIAFQSLSNEASPNRGESDSETLSDSFQSLSPSITSISTPNRDSVISDISSIFSTSPTIFDPSNHKLHRPRLFDASNSSSIQLNDHSSIRPNRYSMPSTSRGSILNNSQHMASSPRRASVPIPQNMEEHPENPYSFNSNYTSSIPITSISLFQHDNDFDDHPDNKNDPFDPNLNYTPRKSSYSSDDGSSSTTASLIHAQVTSRGSQLQRRYNIAFEILKTERHYVDCLLLIKRLFLMPLLNSLSTSNPILTKKSINDIFANFLDLLSLNTELLRRLEDRIMDSTDERQQNKPWNAQDGCLGDIFLNMGPFFKMYSIYVKNFNYALAMIDAQIRENPTFSAFLKDVIKTGQCKGLTLQAYLIMPVQRIPRYKLLLEDLLKRTEETHFDYFNLKKAYQVIENVATFVNETIRQHEMFITMLEIQKSLTGFDEVLLVPARTFIKRGTVKKICRRNHQERDFFLFSDILIYASPGLIDNIYIFHRKFDLEDVTVLSLEDTGAMKHRFQIMSPQKSFTLYTNSLKEKESWINAIREAKNEYLSAKRTLRITEKREPQEREDSYRKRIVENYHAPVWVPDTTTDRCMNCSDEFSLFRRKHHCRACGKVVCHACSTRTFVIPGCSESDDQIVRACDPCIFTMFPDALEDEDLAPGIHVWNLIGYTNNSNNNVASSDLNQSEADLIKSADNIRPARSVTLPNFKFIHEAILAKQCELCQVDFNVFRWRNVCFKCKKIVCTGCLTKKPIDLSLLPEQLLLELLNAHDESEQKSSANQRDSISNGGIRLCDVCFLGIEPNRVVLYEEGGGWAVDGLFSPPLQKSLTAFGENNLEKIPHESQNKGYFDHLKADC